MMWRRLLGQSARLAVPIFFGDICLAAAGSAAAICLEEAAAGAAGLLGAAAGPAATNAPIASSPGSKLLDERERFASSPDCASKAKDLSRSSANRLNGNSRSNGLAVDQACIAKSRGDNPLLPSAGPTGAAPSESCGGGAALAATEGSRRRLLAGPEDFEEVDEEDVIARLSGPEGRGDASETTKKS